MNRATIADVARHAKVSVATVNRVLAGRQPVRPATAARVLEAAEAIGFYGAGAIRQRLNSEAPLRTLGFLVQQKSMPFHTQLARALTVETETSTAIRGRAQIDFSDDLEPATTMRRLMALAETCDAIALVSADHPLLTSAIDELDRRGIPVFALVSELNAPARRGYIGVDDRRMGRTAGWLASKIAREGELAIFVGSHRHLCQEQREIGFRSFIREHAPGFTVLEPYLTHEMENLASDVTDALLKRHPEVRGLFVAGGGILGVLRALRDVGPPAGLCTISVEYNPETLGGAA